MFMVLEWGPQVGSSAYAAGVGVPLDLDLFVKFPVSTTEDCLVYYNSPSCGNAHLLRSDALDAAPTVDDIPVSNALATSGVEVGI